MHYLRKKFIILCLFFLFKLIISQETDSCNCSRNLHTAQIKCLVESTNINSPSCTVTFGQADDVISQAHTRCIEKNVFATEGDHPGRETEAIIKISGVSPSVSPNQDRFRLIIDKCYRIRVTFLLIY